jgi:uncharacterized membrane protein
MKINDVKYIGAGISIIAFFSFIMIKFYSHVEPYVGNYASHLIVPIIIFSTGFSISIILLSLGIRKELREIGDINE